MDAAYRFKYMVRFDSREHPPPLLVVLFCYY